MPPFDTDIPFFMDQQIDYKDLLIWIPPFLHKTIVYGAKTTLSIYTM